jgi:hypothetical protein
MASQVQRLVNKYTNEVGGHLVVLTEERFKALGASTKLWEGYTYKLAYDQFSEQGEAAGGGQIELDAPKFASLEGLLKSRNIEGHVWLDWSSKKHTPRSYISSDAEKVAGFNRTYSLWIERVDEKPLSSEEIRFINAELHI